VSVIDLAELKPHLNSTASADDEELQRTLDAAEQHVTKLCGSLTGGSTTVAAYQSGDQLVLPAVRLTGTPVVVDPDGHTVAIADRDVNLLSGIVRVPYRRRGPWRVTVATSSEMPADVRLAVLIIAAHLWETQRVPGRSTSPGFGQAAAVPTGFAIPNRAATLLAPYMLPVLA
jgi:hypothetical protein